MQVWCCWQVTLCDPHLSALEVRFWRRGAIQIDVYLTYLTSLNLSIGLALLCRCVNWGPTTSQTHNNTYILCYRPQAFLCWIFKSRHVCINCRLCVCTLSRTCQQSHYVTHSKPNLNLYDLTVEVWSGWDPITCPSFPRKAFPRDDAQWYVYACITDIL